MALKAPFSSAAQINEECSAAPSFHAQVWPCCLPNCLPHILDLQLRDEVIYYTESIDGEIVPFARCLGIVLASHIRTSNTCGGHAWSMLRGAAKHAMGLSSRQIYAADVNSGPRMGPLSLDAS